MNLSRDHINFFDLAYFVLPIYAKGEWDPGKKSGSFACQVKCPSIVLEQQGTSSAGTARALGSGNDDVCWAVIPCGMLSNMPAVAIGQAGLEPDDVRGRVECSTRSFCGDALDEQVRERAKFVGAFKEFLAHDGLDLGMAVQRSNFTSLRVWFRRANIFAGVEHLAGTVAPGLCVSSLHKRPTDEPGNRQGKRNDCYGDAAAAMLEEAQRCTGFLGAFHGDDVRVAADDKQIAGKCRERCHRV